jgi:uncharacterized HhH-GPD family protein
MSGTLYVTGDPKSDTLLNNNGLALMIGMLLDQQVPMEWAFNGGPTLKKRLGHLNANRIAEMDPDEFLQICLQKPAIHRFPAAMAKRIQGMCAIIVRDYKGKAENIWADVTTAEQLYQRLRTLPGYGDEKAQIFIALLGKRIGVRPRGWKQAAGEFGDNVPRSIADIDSHDALLKVRATKKAQKAAGVDKRDKPLR